MQTLPTIPPPAILPYLGGQLHNYSSGKRMTVESRIGAALSMRARFSWLKPTTKDNWIHWDGHDGVIVGFGQVSPQAGAKAVGLGLEQPPDLVRRPV